MTRKFLSPIDMTQLEVLNLRLQNISSAPGSPVSGQVWYNTTNARPQWRSTSANNDIYPFATANTINTGVLRDGSGNFSAGTITAALTGTASNATQLNGQADTFYLSRTNHTGTQLASTVSNFDTQVRTSRLDQMAAPTATVSMNSQILSNLLDPVNPQDAATKSYVDAMSAGLDVKGSVRVATAAALPAYSRSGNVITASANGALAAVDGVTLVLNDRLLLRNGATGSDNGLYFVSQVGNAGAPFTLTRTTDSDVSAEVTAGLFTFVSEGSTLADSGWVLTTDNPITLNTTALVFTQFSGAGTYVAGNGISITGTTIAVTLAARLAFNGSLVDLANAGTAGTYTSVTTDQWGRVTAGADITAGTGIVTKTAAGVFTARAVSGTASRVTVTNGDGVAGNPTIDISTSYVGQATITTLGTIATGVWQGTLVGTTYGGTGVNGASAANGTLLIGNGTGYTLATLTAGTNISVTNGSGVITIATGATVLTGTLVSGRIPFANGTQSLTDSSKLTYSVANGISNNRPGTSENEFFGSGSGNNTMTGTSNSGWGFNVLPALTTGSSNTYVGQNGGAALTQGSFNFLGGSSAGQTLATATHCIGIGTGSLNTQQSGSNVVAIGQQSGALAALGTGSNNIYLGYRAGDNSPGATANSMFIANGISRVFYGNEFDAAPIAVTLNSSGGLGTNIAGAALQLAGGIGTGTGAGGAIVFRTAPVGASSATPNTLVTRLTVSGDGAAAWTGIATASAPAVSAASQGRIFYDSTLQAFMVSTNAGAYATMSVGGIGGTLVAGRITLSNGASSVTDSATLLYTAATGLTMAPAAVAIGVQTAETITGAANTNMTLSTEVSDVVYNLARTVQWATGAITTQRAVRVMAPTYAFVGASTVTNAATFAISGAPVAGTNATLTNTYAFWVQGGLSRFDGNLSLNDAVNVVLGTATGTQIGTSNSQKLGFFGATPVAQQTGNISTALATLGLATSGTLPFASLTATPTTLAGYGITNGALNGAVTASGITMSTARLLGRTTAATGAIEEITIGSGLTMSAGVLSANGAGTVAKFAVSIGNGALTTFTITHNLGTLDVTHAIYDNGSGEYVVADVIHATTNTLTVNVAVAPTTNQYRVVVTG